MTSSLAASGQGRARVSFGALWLIGSVVLLPFNLIALPMNMDVVDLWVLLGLPVVLLSLKREGSRVAWPYLVAMWLIFVASLVSSFGTLVPRSSLIVVLKEGYVFVWFMAVTVVVTRLRAAELRLVLNVWAWAVLAHGAVIVVQFLVPGVWQVFAELAERRTDFDFYRPSGLFVNANSAAFFQLLGLVPMLLVRRRVRTTMLMVGAVVVTMLATGSMGAALALVCGAVVAAAAIAMTGHVTAVLRLALRLAGAAALFSLLLFIVIDSVPRYRLHIERILVGRVDRSSEGRFDLWGRGVDAYLDQGILVWGLGPENFRFVDGRDKQLHNDFLAFLVERGIFGALGLGLFALLAIGRAAYIVVLEARAGPKARLRLAVFLGAMIATLVESATHQTFHFREMWLVLALQEAVLLRLPANATAESARLGPLIEAATEPLGAATRTRRPMRPGVVAKAR